MSGRLRFIKGDVLYYTRKGETQIVKVVSIRGCPEGDVQLLTEKPRGGVELGWAHESWFVFTKQEAQARAERWKAQQRPDFPEVV